MKSSELKVEITQETFNVADSIDEREIGKAVEWMQGLLCEQFEEA